MEEKKGTKTNSKAKSNTKSNTSKTNTNKTTTKKTNSNKTTTAKKDVKNTTNKKDTDEIKTKVKKEATETVNQVKDSIKKVDIKKDGVETKGFVIEMVKNPMGKLQDITKKQSAKHFTYALIILAIWMSARLIGECCSIGVQGYTRFFNSLLEIIKATITPALVVLIMSIIVLARNKGNKKSLTTVITAITAAKLPNVISSILSLLTIISVEAYKITAPIGAFLGTISTVLVYFAIKAILGKEKDKDAIKEFIIIEAVYYIISFLLAFLGISI